MNMKCWKKNGRRINKMKGCSDKLITKPLMLDLHKNEDMLAQHPKEHLLKVK